MVNTSRILTVSYGTFSCTLEGFDDPFSTMKSIAEYFRDLAADDRYFGAEPPTPDAEMLHRIAEREIHKRVEARVSENGVVLRQTDDDEDYTSPATLLTDEAGAQAEAARRAAEEEEARSAAAAQAARMAESEQAAQIAAEREAARQAAEDAEAARKAEADRMVAAEEAARRVAEAEAAQAAAAVADAPVSSVSDKLLRLRAVVDQAHVAALPGDYLEDQHADEYFAHGTDAFDDVLEDALADGDAEAVDATADDIAHDDSDAISAVLGSLGHPAVMEEPTVAIDDADEPVGLDRMIEAWDEDEADDGAEPFEPALEGQDALTEALEAEALETAEALAPEAPRPIARVIKVRRPAVPATQAEPEAEPEPEAFEVPGESTLSDDDEAELAAELAAVEREFVDVAEDQEGEADHLNAEHGRIAYGDLGDGDEVALDEVEDDGPLAITPEDAPADRIDRRASLRTAFDAQAMSDTDGAIDRILEKTNTHLESGEASRRRSAIQHLKQAVQATRADRTAANAGTADTDAEEQDAYRADLARVVRPRRPEGGDAEGKRPARRLAPLVLVSEQRIDAPTGAPEPVRHVTPVRPRRLAKGNLAVARSMDDDDEADDDALRAGMAEADAAPGNDDASADGVGAGSGTAALVAGFNAYRDDHGAQSNDEIVEAGVAYLIQEVGRAHTSRPQLMSLVLGAVPEMSREESLRAFGQLLRDARITKVKRGVFVLNDKSRFYDADA